MFEAYNMETKQRALDGANDELRRVEKRCEELSSSLDERQRRVSDLERELAARDKTIANFDFDIVPKLDARIRTLEAALRKIVTMDPCVDWCHFDGDEEEGTDILSIARAALAPTDGDRCKHGVWAADHCYQCAT